MECDLIHLISILCFVWLEASSCLTFVARAKSLVGFERPSVMSAAVALSVYKLIGESWLGCWLMWCSASAIALSSAVRICGVFAPMYSGRVESKMVGPQ